LGSPAHGNLLKSCASPGLAQVATRARLPGRPRCPSGLRKCPLCRLLWPNLSRLALGSGTISCRAFRTPGAGDSSRSPPQKRTNPDSDFLHDLGPAMAHRLYRINQPHMASLYRELVTSRSVTSMSTSRYSGPCEPLRRDKCSDLRGKLGWPPSPYARTIALPDLRASILPNIHSSCYLPICQSIVSQHPWRQVRSHRLHPRPPMPAAPRRMEPRLGKLHCAELSEFLACRQIPSTARAAAPDFQTASPANRLFAALCLCFPLISLNLEAKNLGIRKGILGLGRG
jgi:hypothetical protein